MDERELSAVAWPHERKCPECGKIFVIPMLETWNYRDREQYLCSWGCVRKREKRRDETLRKAAEKRAGLGKLKPAQKEKLIRQMIFRGKTNEQISEETGFSVQNINYYRKKLEEASGG